MSVHAEHTAQATYLKLCVALLLSIFTLGLARAQAQNQASYMVELSELNPQLTQEDVSGLAALVTSDNQLSITLIASGLAPNLMHLQHIHGFMSGEDATCPPPEADTNGDGIIDLTETEAYAGVTLIPLNGAPVDLAIKSSSYPVATGGGLITYKLNVPLDALQTAVQKAYGIEQLSLQHRVVFLHGVPEGVALPATVQSLPGVPAQVTVPVACGVIEAL